MPYNSITNRSNASALIPEDVARDILQAVTYKSAALSMFRRVTMSRKQQRMPVLSALPMAYWVNGDTGHKQTSNVAWSNKFLEAEPLAVIVPIPEDVLADSDFDLWAEIRPRLVEAFGIALDGAVFFGTDKPSSWPDDIVTAATNAGNTYGIGDSTVDLAEDVNQVMALVENDGFDVTGHVARKGLKASFRGLRDDNGQPIFQTSLAQKEYSTLFGENIMFLEHGAWVEGDAHLISGDFSQGIMAVREDITYKLLDQATLTDGSGVIQYNLPQQDMVALRAVGRFAFQVANPLTRSPAASGWAATGSSTTYPFGILTP